jgi:hypothetical protein
VFPSQELDPSDRFSATYGADGSGVFSATDDQVGDTATPIAGSGLQEETQKPQKSPVSIPSPTPEGSGDLTAIYQQDGNTATATAKASNPLRSLASAATPNVPESDRFSKTVAITLGGTKQLQGTGAIGTLTSQMDDSSGEEGGSSLLSSIGIGVAVLVLAALLILFLVLRRRKADENVRLISSEQECDIDEMSPPTGDIPLGSFMNQITYDGEQKQNEPQDEHLAFEENIGENLFQ